MAPVAGTLPHCAAGDGNARAGARPVNGERLLELKRAHDRRELKPGEIAELLAAVGALTTALALAHADLKRCKEERHEQSKLKLV